MFTDFLSYKLERAGKKLVRRLISGIPVQKSAAAAENSKKELKLEDRMYSCICGNQMNRDETQLSIFAEKA